MSEMRTDSGAMSVEPRLPEASSAAPTALATLQLVTANVGSLFEQVWQQQQLYKRCRLSYP